jgi:hypothetical protein
VLKMLSPDDVLDFDPKQFEVRIFGLGHDQTIGMPCHILSYVRHMENICSTGENQGGACGPAHDSLCASVFSMWTVSRRRFVVWPHCYMGHIGGSGK